MDKPKKRVTVPRYNGVTSKAIIFPVTEEADFSLRQTSRSDEKCGGGHTCHFDAEGGLKRK